MSTVSTGGPGFQVLITLASFPDGKGHRLVWRIPTRATGRRIISKPTPAPRPIERNVTQAGTGQITVTSVPQQVNSVSSKKLATKLTQLANGVDVFWGTHAGLTTSNGDLLIGQKGAWIAIPRAVVVFVVCAAGQSTTISWAEAYADE